MSQNDDFYSIQEEQTKQPAPKPKTKRKRGLHWYTKILIAVDLCACACFFTVYGPVPQFKNWYVTTALTTATHQYLAYVFYNEDKVKEIADANTMESINEDSDDSAIQFVEYDDTGTYASIYEEQILKKKNPDDRYKIVEIEEDDYHGYIAVLYDPKGLSLAISKYSNGELVSDFAERTKALVATNAGPFRRDANNNTYPYNVVISKGEVYSTYTKKKTVIGMNADGILMLKSFSTAKEAVKAGYVWGVQFGPNLVINGKKSSFKGNGGYGVQPRTAIGQRKDGIVLLVVIEGRGASGSSGISMPDLAELFVRYGCYNAANLDGGGSSVMVVKNKLMNNPAGWGYSGERYLYNALVYK